MADHDERAYVRRRREAEAVVSTTLTMGSGAFASGSARLTYDVHGHTSDHYMLDGVSYPDDASEDEAYATLNRVRAWDANVRAGWMPIANGRKRMIPVDPEYEVE